LISKIRYFIYFFVPIRVVWKLSRTLPEIANFTLKLFQGVSSLWDEDKEFLKLYKDVKKDILLDKKRAFVIYQSIKNCSHLRGDFAELGVYDGGTIKLISKININNKKIYGFDTFEGFPNHDKKKNPTWKEGGLKADYKTVKKMINDSNVFLIKGFFPNSAKKLPNDLQLSFVHLDADLFESTLSGCEFFYDKLSQGGFLLIDDYGNLSCPGVTNAVDLFFKNKSEKPIFFATGQCLIIKH